MPKRRRSTQRRAPKVAQSAFHCCTQSLTVVPFRMVDGKPATLPSTLPVTLDISSTATYQELLAAAVDKMKVPGDDWRCKREHDTKSNARSLQLLSTRISGGQVRETGVADGRQLDCCEARKDKANRPVVLCARQCFALSTQSIADSDRASCWIPTKLCCRSAVRVRAYTRAHVATPHRFVFEREFKVQREFQAACQRISLRHCRVLVRRTRISSFGCQRSALDSSVIQTAGSAEAVARSACGAEARAARSRSCKRSFRHRSWSVSDAGRRCSACR